MYVIDDALHGVALAVCAYCGVVLGWLVAVFVSVIMGWPLPL